MAYLIIIYAPHASKKAALLLNLNFYNGFLAIRKQKAGKQKEPCSKRSRVQLLRYRNYRAFYLL